ncbi:MAG: hypothetical protein A2381_16005 [Bdellovibrionales bacterium RIFOXYB1_FULL_37_110]|nr:MAG: hypothetical protein A2417_07855 [Bdellovibrionales bacterium RIFOXYC1_FULL_37_79]OFZ57117.1 MAG: hypothetical protein A2381_16005 [Bdellovibrionales bacterium RIFOXYB1_FULL_37_110]OFZ65399.1 MAG: hypothetical protein A2577_03865 [Bdellovibrionales bacterium RIFOXYD1_FULL_36_51]
MKMASVFGSILFLVMGGMIYLSRSLDQMMNMGQDHNINVSDEGPGNKPEDIFKLPKEDLKNKLDQLNDYKKNSVNPQANRGPAEYASSEGGGKNDEVLNEAMSEYKQTIALSLSDQYQSLLAFSQGLSMEDVEEKRMQILNYKNENGIAPEFIETIPFDQYLAASMADKNVYELNIEEIKKIRDRYNQTDILHYFNEKNAVPTTE